METKEERRARIIAEVEASLAEGLPESPDPGWQYPPAPCLPEEPPPPEPPLYLSLLALLVSIGFLLYSLWVLRRR
jgi:hypothetical protein